VLLAHAAAAELAHARRRLLEANLAQFTDPLFQLGGELYRNPRHARSRAKASKRFLNTPSKAASAAECLARSIAWLRIFYSFL
jgi:hypothetical protein